MVTPGSPRVARPNYCASWPRSTWDRARRFLPTTRLPAISPVLRLIGSTASGPGTNATNNLTPPMNKDDDRYGRRAGTGPAPYIILSPPVAPFHPSGDQLGAIIAW